MNVNCDSTDVELSNRLLLVLQLNRGALLNHWRASWMLQRCLTSQNVNFERRKVCWSHRLQIYSYAEFILDLFLCDIFFWADVDFGSVHGVLREFPPCIYLNVYILLTLSKEVRLQNGVQMAAIPVFLCYLSCYIWILLFFLHFFYVILSFFCPYHISRVWALLSGLEYLFIYSFNSQMY